MKTAYVSIDIDYWAWSRSGKVCFEALQKFLCDVYNNSKAPVVAVMNHQQLVPDVNRHQADILINIDTHADIGYEDGVRTLHCGDWVNFIKWRRQADYLWVRPGPIYRGNCQQEHHGGGGGILQLRGTWNLGHGWWSAKTIKREQKLDISSLLRSLDITHISGVGLCLSPDFIGEHEEDAFRKVVDLFKIPYTKGRRNEGYERICKPPRSK